MKSKVDAQKMRGAYYTPPVIAEFMCKWALSDKNNTVLEPSCGDGNFLIAAEQELLKLGATKKSFAKQMVGIEFEPSEAKKAQERSSSTIVSSDFFTVCKKFSEENRRFDVVVGNPPFIRYQNFQEEHREIAFALMEKAGLHPNRLTNAWVPFLIASAQLLTENGKLGMVIPAELFQVSYAAETRLFLTEYFNQITIVTFNKLVFEGIQQEVVLVLADKSKEVPNGVRVIEVNTAKDLASIDFSKIAKLELKPIDHNSEKWTKYFLTKKEILLLKKLKQHPKIPHSKEVMDVDVGVVTGENEFFVINDETVKKFKIDSFVDPIVSKSNHLKGAIFNKKDWVQNVEAGMASKILMAPAMEAKKLAKPLRDYITYGEKNEFNTGYKCRIRKHWYVVPSVWVPEAFMLRQVHAYPKVILNNTDATCTDTVHRVKFLDPKKAEQATAAFMNSLTFAFAEITGRSYGGGVLTFEPSEAEDLPMPMLGSESLNLKEIDKVLRTKDIESVLDITDKHLLIDGLGMSASEVKTLRGIWVKLRDRRINRKHAESSLAEITSAKKPTGKEKKSKAVELPEQLSFGEL